MWNIILASEQIGLKWICFFNISTTRLLTTGCNMTHTHLSNALQFQLRTRFTRQFWQKPWWFGPTFIVRVQFSDGYFVKSESFYLSTFSPINWFIEEAILAAILGLLYINFKFVKLPENEDIGWCILYKVRRKSETKDKSYLGLRWASTYCNLCWRGYMSFEVATILPLVAWVNYSFLLKFMFWKQKVCERVRF